MDGHSSEFEIDIYFGRLDTPEEEARAKRLYGQLSMIVKEYDWIRPGPKFKMIQDRFGQVRIQMNSRMLKYLLHRLAKEEDSEIITDVPPDWWMLLGK